jgi:thioredoxin-like negative regulator of GroEL
MIEIKDYPEFEKMVEDNELVLAYISQPQCSVCVSLLPKVENLMVGYPKIKLVYIDARAVPSAAGQLSVFTIPTVLMFVQGKEYFRLVRTFGITEIEERIEKIYAHFE